jgi:putative hemin transport protein
VFDADGASVHKIYLGETSDAAAYDSLVRRLRSPEQSPALAVESPAPRTLPRPDSEIDARGLAASWAALQDTHDFFAMLRQYSVVRTQAFRLVGPKFAVPAPMTSARAILEGAARTRLPIMVFVNSPGCIQIHTGTVERLKTAGPWLNVLDLDFNLHVREDLVGSAWVVRKPTADGVVTSLELYDSSESLVLQFFGRRKPGLAEDPDWRRAVESLCAPAVA